MRRVRALLLSGAVIGSVSLISSPAHASRPPALYEANFSHGLAGWVMPDSKWAVRDGMMTSRDNDLYVAQAPYHPTTSHYAVEVVMRVSALGVKAGASGQVMVWSHGPTTAIQEPGVSSFVMAGGITGISGYTYRKDLQYLNQFGHPWLPGAAFHTYRLEVQGNMYRQLVDGHTVTNWVQMPGQSANRIGVRTDFASVQVKSFRVLALPPAHPAGVNPLPLLAIGLTPRDMNLPFNYAGFFDASAYSLQSPAPPANTARGYVEGLKAGFADGATNQTQLDLWEYRDAASADAANRAANRYFAVHDRHDGSTIHVTAGLGRDTLTAVGPIRLSGQNWQDVAIHFASGKYVVSLNVLDASTARVKTAEKLARLLYERAARQSS